MGGTLTCEATCPTGTTRVCRTAADCNPGQTCPTFGGAGATGVCTGGGPVDAGGRG